MRLRLPRATYQNAGLAAVLLAGIAATTGLYVTLGVTGVFASMARDQSAVFGAVTICSVTALLCGLLGGYAGAQGQGRWLTVAVATLALGLLLVTLGATLVWSADGLPRLAVRLASVNGAPGLEFDAKADGLSLDDRMSVVVEPLGPGRRTHSAVYTARSGPSRAGDASIAARLPFPPGDYDALLVSAWVNNRHRAVCTKPTDEAACVLIRVPGPQAPYLAAAFVSRRAAVAVTVGSGGGRGRPMHVRMTAASPQRREIARLVVTPEATGARPRRIVLPLPKRARSVCVTASLTDDLRCPSPDPAATWVRLSRTR